MQQTLNELALFDVTGEDAASFLQGQLTQDMLHWQAHEIKRAAWCSVKGRMLASFYVWPIEHGFRLLMARDLTEKLLPRLRMFVMRAKVVVSAPLDLPLYICQSGNAPLSIDGSQFTLLSSGYGITTDLTDAAKATLAEPVSWLLAHIQAGVAWVSAGNSEQFVPQTANFELVSGIHFRKGCYPGQEIVARSQYLGKLKQRAAIAQLQGTANVLDDVFEAASANPVGRVIQASGDWVLFDAPHRLIEAATPLYLASQAGVQLKVQALPYPILDVTA